MKSRSRCNITFDGHLNYCKTDKILKRNGSKVRAKSIHENIKCAYLLIKTDYHMLMYLAWCVKSIVHIFSLFYAFNEWDQFYVYWIGRHK